jgi:hypothetical protein
MELLMPRASSKKPAKKRIDTRTNRNRQRSLIQLTEAERDECSAEARSMGLPLSVFLAQLVRSGLECWRDEMAL